MPIKSIIEERALLLWEKIIRIPEYLSLWNDSLSYIKRNLKTQRGFLQEVMALKELHDFKFEPEDLIKSPCPTERCDFALSTELLHDVRKKETNGQILRILSLETLNTLYPGDLIKWPMRTVPLRRKNNNNLEKLSLSNKQ